MDFKAAFERYQNGTASEEEKEYIEQELEKNELITQYLLETDGMELTSLPRRQMEKQRTD